MIRNILVPVDFSHCSKNALRISIQIAKAFKAKIHMVNAVHVHAPHPDLAGGSIVEAIIMDYEEQVKEAFEELESDLFELKEVPHEADRFLSYLTDAVYTETKKKKIDLIIMGTRKDHTGFEQFFGTRATDVMKSATVPVMIIPEEYQNFKLERVGYAVDLEGIKNYRNLDFLNLLGKKFKTEVLAFSIVKRPEQLSSKQQSLMEEIRKRLSDCSCSVRAVEASSITDGIVEFTEKHELDMIAVTPKEYSFFTSLFRKSVSRQVVMDVKIPLLSFHE